MSRIDLRERLEGTIERRTFNAALELRAGEGPNGPRLVGYATTFETPYNVGGPDGFTETIGRGALKQSLRSEPDVVLLVNHDGIPLARTSSGTMTLSEDHRGLRVEADLDASNPDVQRLISPMKRGDMNAMSMAFRATGQQWSEDRSERLITAMSIHRGDVSVVSSPANESTSVSLRRASELGNSTRSVTRWSQIELSRSYAAKGGGERRSDTSPFGDFWVIKTSRDVMKAVRQVELGRAKGKEASVKAWIIKRAEALGCSDLIPKTNWSAGPAAVGSGAGR